MGQIKDEWTNQMAQDNGDNTTRLRDTFAAAALTGLLSNIPTYQLGVLPRQAYDIADAMLEEREKTNTAAPPVAQPVQSSAESVPTLTREERVAIWYFADIHSDDEPPHEYAVVLGKLLARLA
jgi:hypothetical protein